MVQEFDRKYPELNRPLNGGPSAKEIADARKPAEAARKKAQSDAKQRVGRKGTVLTGSRGVKDKLGSIKQTSAGGVSKVLG